MAMALLGWYRISQDWNWRYKSMESLVNVLWPNAVKLSNYCPVGCAVRTANV